MDSSLKLTVIENSNNISSPEDTKLQLEENYYEKLFLEEMNFRNNPNKASMKNIIRKHCHAVEYFSSIGDDKRAMRYKLLNNIFLNDPQVIQTLDEEDSNNNNINDSKNNLITNILILNQKKNNERFKENNDTNIIESKFNFVFNKEQEKLDELIKKKNSFENKIESINIINDEIQTQQNNFKRNLTLKMQKKKSLNENKILQGIKNVLINGKNKDNKFNNNDEEEIEMINNSEMNEIPMTNIEKKISPIKLDQNYSDKETTTSNGLKFDSNNNYINPLLNSANNKKNTSEFEPLTPINNDKLEKTNEFRSSAKQDISIISEEVNETNDFSLTNNDNNYNNNISSAENINKKEIMLNQVEISSNETKCSNNAISLSNSSSINKTLSDSKLSNSDLLKSFRLDFNDLFDYIKEHQNATKKMTSFCNDIKVIIENYISDFNQHLSKNLITKIIKKFSDIWDEMFKKYTDISEFFDKEIKQIDFDNTQNKSNISELSNLIDSINNEKENALNQNEEKFMSQIENSEIYFKANYNKIDNGILLLNEKFAYVITKRVYDMINNV